MSNIEIRTEKILSPSNIRRIIMLGVSLRNEMENISKGLISEYDSTVTYTKGMSCYYDGYLYKCIYTTTGTWDSTKWQKIGDNLDLLTLDDIKALINLSDEEIASLQSLISTEIRLDKCFSSSDTYNRLLTVENNCKTFTMEQLAKKAGVVYKIVADTTGVDSTEFLYLIPNGSNGYNIYAYIDGSAKKISDTNINLDGYAKLTDLDNYYDKATSDGKYATITTVDGKVDKTSILTEISDNPSNDKVLGEKATKTELDKKIDKTSIVTTIDNTVTDEQLASARAIFDDINYTEIYEIPTNTVDDILEGLRNVERNKTKIIKIYDGSAELFGVAGNYIGLVAAVNGNEVVGYFVNHWHPNIVYTCKVQSIDTELDLSRVCTTSAVDVSETFITSYLDETYVKPTNTNTNSYRVTNGICELRIEASCLATTNTLTKILSGLPKAKQTKYANAVNRNVTLSTNASALFMVAGSDLYVVCNYGDTSVSGSRGFYASLTYPVAES